MILLFCSVFLAADRWSPSALLWGRCRERWQSQRQCDLPFDPQTPLTAHATAQTCRKSCGLYEAFVKLTPNQVEKRSNPNTKCIGGVVWRKEVSYWQWKRDLQQPFESFLMNTCEWTPFSGALQLWPWEYWIQDKEIQAMRVCWWILYGCKKQRHPGSSTQLLSQPRSHNRLDEQFIFLPGK